MTSLNDLFKELSVHTTNSDHESIYDTSYEILKASPHNMKALRLTIVSLINLEKYEQASKIFQQFKSSIDTDELSLEKAYIYYKLGEESQLSEIFQTLQTQLGEQTLLKQNPGIIHLKAQSLYRSGEYAEALRLYQLLLAEGNDEEDLKVNERAVISDALTSGKLDKLNQFEKENESTCSYDLMFNQSLIALALGDHTKSLDLLNKAQELSEEVNVDEQDKLSETIPIVIQKAYLYHITGNIIEAKRILSELQNLQLSDDLIQLIFNINWIAINSSTSTSPRLTLRELQLSNSVQKLSSRLSQIQQSTIWRNYSKLCIQIGKNISVSTDLTVDALSLLQNKTQVNIDEQDPSTQAKLSTRIALKSANMGLSLLSAQLNINANKYDAAIAVLENLSIEDKLQPSVATILLSLYEHQGSDKKKLELFELIFSKFEDSLEFSTSEFELLKLFALKLSTLQPFKTQALLQKLQHFNPSDEIIQLVFSSNTTLPSIKDLTSTLDLTTLESQALIQINAEKKSTSSTSYKIHKRQRKRKNFSPDTTKTLDSERWLPMKDRSYYKPKKSKKNKSMATTQGGVADNTTEVSTSTSKIIPSKNKNKKKGKK